MLTPENRLFIKIGKETFERKECVKECLNPQCRCGKTFVYDGKTYCQTYIDPSQKWLKDKKDRYFMRCGLNKELTSEIKAKLEALKTGEGPTRATRKIARVSSPQPQKPQEKAKKPEKKKKSEKQNKR